MKQLTIAAVIAGISFTGAAHAADAVVPEEVLPVSANEHYISIFAGGVFHTDNVEYTNGITVVDTDFDAGYTIGAAIGKRLPEHSFNDFTPRLELAFSYSENEVDTINFSGNGPGQEVVTAGSQASAVTFLVNGFLDADDAFGEGITPYFGGGIGLGLVNHNLNYNGGLNLNDNNDAVFAWNVTAGVSFEINENVDFFTDVGFHQLVDTSSVRRNGAVALAGAGGGEFEDDINSIVARVGLSVSFDGF